MRRLLLFCALFAGCAGLGADAQKAEFLGRYVWTGSGEDFGGWSGLDLSEDGTAFVAVGDRGVIARGQIERSGGVISDVALTRLERMRGLMGRPVSGRGQDAEGLAVAPDGAVYVSFEARARVLRFDDPFAPAVQVLSDPRFKAFQSNSGMESLAVDASGALYTLPERSGRADRPFTVLRFDGEGWAPAFEIPRRGVHLPVGADIGPDGRFYLLERDFTGVGFRSRVRRFDLGGGSEETLLETPNGTHGNLEGISVWQTDSGALMITMVADDNFHFLQETEFVEYRIDG